MPTTSSRSLRTLNVWGWSVLSNRRRWTAPTLNYSAHYASMPSNAVTWLKKDNDGALGPLSKRTWLKACEVCPKLKDAGVERVG
jgi:hypothetical protein